MSEQADAPSLIEYPCDFPIKIMGPRVEGFAQEIARVVQGFVPAFEAGSIEMRSSRTGRYLSLTCTVHVTSRAQLDDLYRALSAHPMVRVVL
jgi:putative lipoic acid-binding regulatory protein